MVKKLLKVFIYLLIAIAVLCLGLYLYLRSTAPNYEGKAEISILDQSVKVNFDSYGIPHIYADNPIDAYRALGYVHAQDRLFQMEMVRRVSSGRLSEVLGEKFVKTDKFFRTLGLRRMAEHNAEVNLNTNEEDWQKHTLAYLDGINAFVQNGTTPLEFKIIGIPKTDFDIADIYSILGYMGLGFSKALDEDPIMEKIRATNGESYFEDWLLDTKILDTIGIGKSPVEDLSAILPQNIEDYLGLANMPLFYGSNSWVIAPEKSKSGKVILSNDTHIGISQPSVWYEAHITYPGFDFYGNYLAGVPFGVIGHSKDIAWGLTIFPFDGIDLYREKINPENAQEVWENDHWTPVEIQHEKIQVKGQEEVDFVRKVTRHGPIINDVSSELDSLEKEPISFWWGFLDQPTKTLQAIYEMNHASTMQEAKKGASQIDFIGLNVLYGDQEGNIAHWACGKIPKRPAHVNPKFILDGASGQDELLGYYEFHENPQIENPASGFVASGNNDPGMVGENYFPGYYCPPNRYNRIAFHLNGQSHWSQEDMKKIQLDDTSDEHKKIANLLCTALLSSNSDIEEKDQSILTELSNWPGSYGMKETNPVIYTKFIYHTMRLAMEDEIGSDDFNDIQGSYIYKGSIWKVLKNENSIWWDNILTAELKETRLNAVQEAFKITMEELEEQLGSNREQWTWDRVHTITHRHPLSSQKPLDKIFNVGPFAIGGGNDVPNKMMYKPSSSGVYQVYSSPALRILLDFDNVYGSESINPTGQSGNVMSKHYNDQALMFNSGVYRPQLMDKEEIEKESSTLMLVPE
ncbi:MAG: penicillin acylase family protein [Saprospiraceae bacterium]|nr:penicillin acylase family protein [Saprospiraceae bacterium]